MLLEFLNVRGRFVQEIALAVRKLAPIGTRLDLAVALGTKN
jgi:hypothetical protein